MEGLTSIRRNNEILDYFIKCKEAKLADPYQSVADRYDMTRQEVKTKVFSLMYSHGAIE